MDKVDLQYGYDVNLPPENTGSEEWHQSRNGRFTASMTESWMQEGRSKGQLFGTKAEAYLYAKVAEILSGAPHLITSKSMEWGQDFEAEAIEKYQEATGNTVDHTGFVEFGDFSGGTPDGLVDTTGIIEVKCPFNPANHIQTILENRVVKKEYQLQIQMNLLATGRLWCDFVSYDPRVQEEHLKIHVIRIERDEATIKAIQDRLQVVINRLNELLKQARELGLNYNAR